VGGLIGRALLLANIPFVAVDYNFSTVLQAKKEGVNIIYGDPTDLDILDYVQVDEALVLISVVPNLKDQEALILNAKKLNRNIFIIARAHSEVNKKRLKDLGVDMIIQPEFEASLAIIRRVFSHFNLPKEKIIEKLKLLRIQSGF
jgi:CPA2 family monovalent cation:H+ antiporter-2